jgi:hypothetical protein
LPSLPIAAFLVGSLLTILLPIGLVIALSIWSWIYVGRVPETSRQRESQTDPAAATPAPDIPQALPADPGV